MSDQPAVSVHLLPSLIAPGALTGGVAVVVDVLRATTVMVHALAAGCEAVIPCGEIDEARAVAAGLPPGTALLGGERGGLPIPGFDLGNSPGDFTPEVCRGKTLVLTTTNGTRAILASLDAERVLIAALVNLEAVGFALRGETRPIHLVCAGTEGLVSFEDTLAAGGLVDFLVPHPIWECERVNDSARIVQGLWDSVYDRIEIGNLTVSEALRQGRGGRRVQQIGLAADIEAAAQVGRFDLVPELRRAPLRIICPGGSKRLASGSESSPLPPCGGGLG